RGAADEKTAGVQRFGLWTGRGDFLRRLFFLSASEQSDLVSSWAAALDCLFDDCVGNRLLLHDVRRVGAQLLYPATLAGCCGGGLFSRRDSLHEELVPCGRACEGVCDVPHGGTDFRNHWRTNFGSFAAAGQAAWTRGLAVAVFD